MKKYMKKRLYAYGSLLLTLTVLLALVLPLQQANQWEHSTQSTLSTSGGTRPARGSVQLYTCDPALASVFTSLAEAYTKQTGIQVTVITGSADSCGSDLEKAMASEAAPTLFCLHSREDMEKWQDSLYDLTGSALLEKLWSPDFALGADGKKLAITVDLEGSGLIYNATLMAQAGFTRSDIQDLADLEMVAQFITGKDLGYAAFSAIDLSATDHGSMACLLAGMLPTADALRSFWDLYLANSQRSGKSLDSFLAEDAVFYLGSTRDYEQVSGLGVSNLDILPAYSSAGSGLSCVSTLCWGVSSQAATQDIQQTLAFLDWLVTATEEGPAPIDGLGLLSPFRDAAAYSNLLEKKLRTYLSTEPATVSWDCCGSLSEDSLSALAAALATYSDDPTDENWQAVAAAYGADS